MPTPFDLAYVALVAVVWPAYDRLRWPAQARRLRAAPDHGRPRLYAEAIATQWLLVGVGLVYWVRAGRAWAPLGVQLPHGWRLAAALVVGGGLAALHGRNLRVVARRPSARAQARRLAAPLALVLPHTGRELAAFLALSVTAGVCEEVLFRGYLPWALAPWLTWAGAVLAGAVPFGLLHAYQGRAGVVRTAATGVVLAGVVALTGSLLPAIAAHALTNVGSGLLAWLALRDAQPADALLDDALPSAAMPRPHPTAEPAAHA